MFGAVPGAGRVTWRVRELHYACGCMFTSFGVPDDEEGKPGHYRHQDEGIAYTVGRTWSDLRYGQVGEYLRSEPDPGCHLTQKQGALF